jgi:hypothetical protein
MPLTRRHTPEHPAGSTESFGCDFSPVIPKGIAPVSAALAIFTNANPPAAADADWSKGRAYQRGRCVFQLLTGGKAGVDYLLQWTVTDSRANVWVRTGMVLCASTS